MAGWVDVTAPANIDNPVIESVWTSSVNAQWVFGGGVWTMQTQGDWWQVNPEFGLMFTESIAVRAATVEAAGGFAGLRVTVPQSSMWETYPNNPFFVWEFWTGSEGVLVERTVVDNVYTLIPQRLITPSEVAGYGIAPPFATGSLSLFDQLVGEILGPPPAFGIDWWNESYVITKIELLSLGDAAFWNPLNLTRERPL